MENGIEKKLSCLRKRWLKEPDNRKIIEMQAKLLQYANTPTYGEIKQIFS